MRQVGNVGGAGKRLVSATPRQLESCVRLSEALAKMELSEIVSADHVREALRLMRAAIQSAATDPITGQIDMDLINTGRSAMSRQAMQVRYRLSFFHYNLGIPLLEIIVTELGSLHRLQGIRADVGAWACNPGY